MANLVQVEATALLNASFAKATYTAPTTPLMLRLLTAVGDATTPGTEVANAGGSTYAAQSLAAALGTAAAGSLTNSAAAVTYTNMPATTINGVAIWDSAGTPVRRWFGALTTAKTTGLGDTLTFAQNTITASLS
jgi:hypothetical protein